MRKVIVMMSMTLDGHISGTHGELDWLDSGEDDKDSWARVFEFLEEIDACVLGRGMYAEYAKYWQSLLDSKEATDEVAYARWADRTPHFLVSRTVGQADWKNTRVVRDLEEIRKLKQQAGKDIYVVGGATLVSSLVNAGLVDELRLSVYPIVAGQGKALFKDVTQRHVLELIEGKTTKSGKQLLRYRVKS
jgi:dihydrofolate reductase